MLSVCTGLSGLGLAVCLVGILVHSPTLRKCPCKALIGAAAPLHAAWGEWEQQQLLPAKGISGKPVMACHCCAPQCCEHHLHASGGVVRTPLAMRCVAAALCGSSVASLVADVEVISGGG